MSTPDHDCLDAETILNDLCASKINASISWIGDGGFHFVLGDPPQAEGWAFSTIGAAVTGKLIRFGWLDPNKRDDKEAIARALVELAEKATELEVTPASCST